MHNNKSDETACLNSSQFSVLQGMIKDIVPIAVNIIPVCSLSYQSLNHGKDTSPVTIRNVDGGTPINFPEIIFELKITSMWNKVKV